MPRARGNTTARGTGGGRGQSKSARGQPGSRRGRTTNKKAPRPEVISLDVTYSSDELDLDESEDEIITEPEKEVEKPLFTPSPPAERRNGRGIMSDSESDLEEVVLKDELPNAKKLKVQDSPEECLDDDSNDDLFAVDFTFRKNAIKDAMKEMEEQSENDATPQQNVNLSASLSVIDVEEEKQDKENDVIMEDSLSIINSPSSPMPKVKVNKRKMLKRNKETQKAMKVLQALAKEMSSKDNDVDSDTFNQSGISDIVILSDDEQDDTNLEMNLRVRWGSEYLRLPMKKTQKFSYIYQTFAERFSVPVSQVVLSHKDKVINPEMSPKDLGLTVADTVEGGIQSRDYSTNTIMSENSDSGTIRLKVQNADKKGVVNIYISRYDKMQVLMQKYADEKKVNLSKLKFQFDGEKLNPNDTPDILDLDGDECIDVFHC